MNIFYHTSNVELTKSEILYPRYGEIIQDPRYFRHNDYNYSQYLKEIIFEEVRKTHFPSLPSRLKSTYLVDSFEMAIVYQKRQGKKYVYEVEIEDSDRILKADMTWMDKSNRQSFEMVKQYAANYYSGKFTDNGFWEFLYDGKVVIRKRC